MGQLLSHADSLVGRDIVKGMVGGRLTKLVATSMLVRCIIS